MEYLESIVKELASKEQPVNIVYVDWAAEEQHAGNGTPLRDIVKDPVLQSPWHKEDDSFQALWCEGEIERCDVALFALDKSGCIIGRFPWFPSIDDPPVSLEDKKQYKKLRRLVRLALQGARPE